MTNLVISQFIIRQDTSGRYCLNDLHKAAVVSGRAKAAHKPANFMRRKETKALEAAIIRRCSDLSITPSVVVKGNFSSLEQGTFVCRQMVYAYAMWIDADFHLDVIEAFDAMQQINKSAWQQLQALVAREVESKMRASFGSHLMLQRKRELPALKHDIEALELIVQPDLLVKH